MDVLPTPLNDPARLAQLALTGLSAEPDEALDRFARMVSSYVGASTGLVSLVDSQRQFFPGAQGLPEPWASARETPLSHSVCQHVVVTGEPLVVSDLREREDLRDNLAIPDIGVIAYAGMPLTDDRGNVLGSLCAISGEPHDWTEAELGILSDLAAACSSELRLRMAASNARAAEVGADDDARRMRLAAEVTMVLSSTLDVDDAMQRLVNLLVPGLADWAVVTLLGSGQELRQVAHLHRNGLQDTMERYVRVLSESATSESPTRRVLAGGPAEFLPQLSLERVVASSNDPEMAELIEALGFSSYIVVPLAARGRILGAVSLICIDREFTRQDFDLAVDLGSRAGLSMDNARLYAGQRRVAETLQRSMLTQLPESDRLELQARYRASGDHAQVGGDWYDAFVQPDGGTVLVIGDVMGHDISAAAAMGQVRNLLRGTAYDRGESPAAVLERVDAALSGLRVEAMATSVVARLEQSAEQAAAGTRTVRWSNAGHPPPMLLQVDGSVVRLETPPDLLLGVGTTAVRHDHTVELTAGATLLMFTDGLVEHRLLSLDGGLAALEQALVGQQHVPLETLCDNVIAALSPSEPLDDIALIAVRPTSH